MAIRFDQIELSSSGHDYYPVLSGVNSAQYLQIQTSHGYTRIGANNTSWTHFYTDRNNYYFNRGASFDGNIAAYGGSHTASFATYYDSNNTNYYVNPAGGAVIQTLTIDDYIYHKGDTNTYLYFESDSIKLRTGGDDRLVLNNNEAYFQRPVVAPNLGRNNDDQVLFAITEQDTSETIRRKFGNTGLTAITKVDDSTAPADGCFQLTDQYENITIPQFFKVDDNSEYTFEVWVKFVSGSDTDQKLYAGCTFYDLNKSSLGNTQRYWGESAEQIDANTRQDGNWYHFSGTLGPSRGSNTGEIHANAQWMKLILLLNYSNNANTVRYCGLKFYKSGGRQNRMFTSIYRKSLGSQGSTASDSWLGKTVMDTSGNLYTPEKLIHYDDTDTYFSFSADDQISLVAAGTTRLRVEGDVKVLGTTDLNIQGTSRRLQFTAGTGTVRTTTANNLILQTNSTTRQTITTTYSEEAGSYRAPIFYDSNNTSYYVNPNDRSYLLELFVPPTSSATSGATIRTYAWSDPNWGFSTFASNPNYHVRVHGYGDSHGTDRQFQVVNAASSNAVQFAVNFDGTGTAIGATGTESGYKLTVHGSMHMKNDDINYVSQLHFNDNVRFYDNGNDNYLTFKYGDSNNGGIIFVNGGGTTKGYVYGSDTGFGLLDKDGHWVLQTNGTSFTALRANDNEELIVYENRVEIPGDIRAPIYYDKDDTGRYVNPGGTSSFGTIHMNNNNLTNVNHITFNDAGAGEGLEWLNGNGWKIYESPDDQSNAGGNLQFVTGSTRLGTITTAGTLELSGGGIGSVNENVAKVLYPKGATYTESTNNVTGAIKITLPQSWTNTMMTIHVSIFDYSSNESFDLILSGYNYTGDGGYWTNCTSQAIAHPQQNKSFNIRYGHDGTKCCIFIGETSSTWSYPKVVVTKFMGGHGNYQFSKWDDGWDITRETSLASNIDITQVAYQQNRYIQQLFDIDDTSYFVNPASNSTLLEASIGTTAGVPGSYRLNMGGNIHMNNNQIDYVSQLHFNDNVRFYDDGNDSHLNFKWGDTGAGGIKFVDGDGDLQGHVYGAGNGRFGLLDKDGSWVLETDGASFTGLRSNGNEELIIYNDRVEIPGDIRAPIFYDRDNTTYYANPAGTSNMNEITAVSYVRSLGNYQVTLDGVGSGGPKIEFGATNDWDQYGHIGHQGGEYQFGTHNRDFAWYQGTTKIMELDYGGANQEPVLAIGWNVAADNTKGTLQVFGHNNTDGTLRLGPHSSKGSTFSHVHYGSNGDWYIRPASNSGSVFVLNYSAISDERLKENIVDSEYGLSEITSLRPRNFNWIDSATDDVHTGFVAQEVEAVVSKWITQGELDDHKSVDYNAITATLVKAVQELKAENEDLLNRVKALENK